MADPLPPDRLLRKRNCNLQKQLDYSLQILSEEYRQCKERLYKEERDCGKFLQSLYETVPGLQTYGHPNTRSMNPADVLRQRKFSALPGMPAQTDGSTVTDSDGNHQFIQHTSSPQSSPSATAGTGSRKNDQSQRGNDSGTRVSEKRSTSSSLGSGPFRDGSQSASLVRKKVQANRPKTADANYFSTSVNPNGRLQRPTTSFGFRKSRKPCYGKSAYSDHDRTVQEIVLKKFESIFHPEVRKDGKITTSVFVPVPYMTHDSKSVSEDQQSSSTDDTNGHVSESADEDGLKTSQVTEEEHSGNQKVHRPRMVWSAKVRPAPEAPSVDPVYSKPRSYSLSLPDRNHRIQTVDGHGRLEHSHVGSELQDQASQRNAVANGGVNHHPIQDKLHRKSEERSVSRTPHIQRNTTDLDVQHQKRLSRSRRRLSNFTKSESDTHVLNKHHAPTSLSHSKTNASPETYSETITQVTTRRRSAGHRSTGRLSDVSVLIAPGQLVDKLMNAGRTPCSQSRRPKTAPSKSELSHRLVPVSRKIIVGILSEIENQKASTRTMLATSMELQQVVKKLVPEEYRLEDDSD